MRTAVFPGSFDPFTIGHADVVARALQLFDKVIVVIGVNADKKTLFSPEERLRQVQAATLMNLAWKWCCGRACWPIWPCNVRLVV